MSAVSNATPARSLQQRMDALQRANEIRSKRAVLKRDLKAGRARLADAIDSPPEWLRSMKVLDLILATPKFGQYKATQALNHCRVSLGKTVGGLTDRQRHELLDRLWAIERDRGRS